MAFQDPGLSHSLGWLQLPLPGKTTPGAYEYNIISLNGRF